MKSSHPIFEIKIHTEEDIIHVHRVVRELSILAGLSVQSQTRFLTAVCEIANNALQYAGGGKIGFFLASEDGVNYKIQACVEDDGPGIDSMAQKEFQENSDLATGKGITTAKNLVHYFQIESDNNGTKVILEKNLPADIVLSPTDTVDVWIKPLNKLQTTSAIEELQKSNHQLVKALMDVEKSAELLYKQEVILEQHTEQLETANKTKINFVANMSHEMRTPLNAIIGISDILSKTVLNKHQQFLVNSLDAAGRSLLSLINDILDLSKLEAGKFEIEDADFSLVDTVREALSVVQPQALEKYVDLLIFCGSFLPEKVNGDAHRLQQIIINIAANAIKFSSQNSETDVFVFGYTSSKNIAEIRFVVFDTGIGISESDQKRIFEAFSQVDASANRKYGGSGLGLSISRHLINLMNGEIGCFSRKNIGTAFWFNLPFTYKGNFTPGFRRDLENLEIVFIKDDLSTFELLLKALGIKYQHLKNREEIAQLKSKATHKIIDISELTTDFASSKPSRLFNHIMEYAELPYRIENFRSGKEKFLLGRKPFSRKLSACGSALLVEDHTMNQLIGRLQLEELGFNVDVCSTGTEALQSIISKKYSIIFMDCQIPEMDGYEITREIRNLEVQTSTYTPIIALTASALDGEREKCLAAGMDDYLTKPVDPELLYKMCKKWLNDLNLMVKEEVISEILDHKKLIATFSKEQYSQLVQMFLEDTVRLLGELEKNIALRNEQTAVINTHTLQGASRMIYAKSLADNYRNMEAALRAQMWQTAEEILEEIRSQFNQVKDELLIYTN